MQICDSFSHDLSLSFSRSFISSHAFSSLENLIPHVRALQLQQPIITPPSQTEGGINIRTYLLKFETRISPTEASGEDLNTATESAVPTS